MASQGPNSAGTGADDATIGTSSWSSPGNVTSSNDSRASTGVPASGGISHYLKATNFGFSVPAGATIDGIYVECECLHFTGGGPDIFDSSIRLVIGGSFTGDNKADGTGWPYSDTYKVWGGSSDLWGTTPSVSDVNASDFGVGISARNTAGGERSAHIDHIRITVYYTEAAAGQPVTKRWQSIQHQGGQRRFGAGTRGI